jgi:hypothetical protein
VFRRVTCKNALTNRENAAKYSWLEELFLGGCPEVGALGFGSVQSFLGALLTSLQGIGRDSVGDYGRVHGRIRT